MSSRQICFTYLFMSSQNATLLYLTPVFFLSALWVFFLRTLVSFFCSVPFLFTLTFILLQSSATIVQLKSFFFFQERHITKKQDGDFQWTNTPQCFPVCIMLNIFRKNTPFLIAFTSTIWVIVCYSRAMMYSSNNNYLCSALSHFFS